MSLQTDSTAWTPGAITPAPSFPALVRSEVSRIHRRRLLRILAAILLAGITVVLAIAFVQSSADINVPPRVEEQLAEQQESVLQAWERCIARHAGESDVQSNCGDKPVGANGPQLDWYMIDPRFMAVDNIPSLFIGLVGVMATLAFIIGASVGGAEWSSRSMTLQLLWEPRRLRLLAAKWLALLVVMALLAALALLVGLALASVNVQLRGSWEGLPPDFWSDQWGTASRGLLLIGAAATVGLGISTALRNTGAALGAAFVYFAVAEFAFRFVLAKYGPDPYLITGNAVATILPDGFDVPGKTVETREPGGGGVFTQQEAVHLTHARAAITLSVYAAVAAGAAALSFARRDVG